MCAVPGWNDALGLGTRHVRTPIRHDTIAGFRPVPFSSVAADDVIRNAGGDRDSINRFHESVVRFKRVHAVGDTSDSHVFGQRVCGFGGIVARLVEPERQPDQA